MFRFVPGDMILAVCRSNSAEPDKLTHPVGFFVNLLPHSKKACHVIIDCHLHQISFAVRDAPEHTVKQWPARRIGMPCHRFSDLHKRARDRYERRAPAKTAVSL